MDLKIIPIEPESSSTHAKAIHICCKGKSPEQIRNTFVNIWCMHFGSNEKIIIELHEPTSAALIAVSEFIFSNDFSHICTLKVIGAVHPYDFQFTV